ncbi:TRAM domain-containing protein [Candidatus Woesearchaeota archaeon]|nr:TRAM domain-containing protein [Candidatus Woesearchaeota archaeon]
MRKDDRGFRSNRIAPVNVGDELDVKIEAVGEKGDGIAKKNGFVLFVPNTSTGDQVRIRVKKVLSKVGFAEVVGKSEQQESESEESSEESEESEPQESEPEADAEESTEDSEDFGEEEQ